MPASWPPDLYHADAIRYALDWRSTHPGDDDWGFHYLVLRGDNGAGGVGGARTLIGAGGFRGAPDANGSVEVGYSLLADHQRRGYATEAVEAWVAFAFSDPRVTRVIAQTLVGLTPSIRVLERAGFTFAGTGDDPHAPPGEQVIRYERTR